MGPNPSNPLPARGFAATSAHRVSAKLSGNRNNTPLAALSCWLAAPMYPGLILPHKKANTGEGEVFFGPEMKNKGQFLSSGRGRLNKVNNSNNKKGHQTNFLLKPMNLD